MSARQSWSKRIALAVSAVLIALWSSMLVPGYALGAAGAPAPGNGGNNGTVKICDVANGCPSSNDPHLGCPITIQWADFDNALAANPNTYDVTFTGIAPTNGSVAANGGGNTDHGTFTGTSTSKQYTLVVTGGTPNNKGEFHIGIDITTTTANGSDFKQKTVWFTPCAGPAGSVDVGVTKDGTSNAFVGDPVTYTVVATVVAGPTSGTTTVTDTLPNGITNGSMAYTSGAGTWTCNSLSCSTTDALATAASTTFTVSATASAAGSQTDSVTVSAVGDSNALNNTATKTTVVTAPGSLTLAAACSGANAGQIAWTVTNPATNPTVNTLVLNGSAAVLSATTAAPGASVTFTTAAPQNSALSVTGKTTPGNQNVSSNSLSFNGTCTNPGTPETPASVAFSSTCTGIHAVFTSADQHTTTFTVTAPHNVTDTVNGSGTRDYNADKNDAHLSVSYDGKSQTYDWVDPGNCSAPPPPGQAQPGATATNACVTGITVVLSNMNGTAPATFTVTAPDGTTTTVPVNAGQLKKLDFSVAEDSTGVVTVSAPGLAKTFTYAKNCTKVLGEKHTVQPPKTPTKVLGEKSQLPFTGFNAKSALFDAASLMAFGAIVCGLAMPRRRRFSPYPEG